MQPSSILCLVALVSLAGCDPEPHTIGSLETGESGESGESSASNSSTTEDTDDTSDTDDTDAPGDSCVQPGVLASFVLEGLQDGSIYDLTLSCSSSLLDDEGEVQHIALTDCSDAQLGAYPDLELQLSGDWPLLPTNGQLEGQLELRYFESGLAVTIDQVSHDWGTGRWLVLRNPETLSVELIAVDAPTTYPSLWGVDLNYAPLSVDLDDAGCELIPHPSCAPMKPAAVILGTDDEGFSAREGELALGFAGDDMYTMLVERNREFVDDCFDFPAEHRFGMVRSEN